MLKGNGIAGITHALAHKANMYLIYLLPDSVKMFQID